jgi:hypothetical protein
MRAFPSSLVLHLLLHALRQHMTLLLALQLHWQQRASGAHCGTFLSSATESPGPQIIPQREGLGATCSTPVHGTQRFQALAPCGPPIL